jgi:hypothetical protein
MKPYSDYAPQRIRQVLCDLVAVTFIYLWVRLGTWVYSEIVALKQWGQSMEGAGSGFRSTMTDVGARLGEVPFIGDAVRGPFDQASRAGAELEAAGVQQQEAVQNIALITGVSVAVLPILSILVMWLYPRVRFAVRAHRSKQLALTGAGVDLFALRALLNQRPHRLLAIHADPAGAWRSQDPDVIAELARMELHASGVRLPADAPVPGGGDRDLP